MCRGEEALEDLSEAVSPRAQAVCKLQGGSWSETHEVDSATPLEEDTDGRDEDRDC